VGTTVSVVDISSNTIVATIPVGIQPSGIAITPDGAYAYVSNYSTLYDGPNFTDLTA
jgi:DNA-binding beta-propeller fold protein YncE